jgi:beta-glucosidase-like glycosyl hydrolase/CubicO group peptidase (beta-lactamase class C family)
MRKILLGLIAAVLLVSPTTSQERKTAPATKPLPRKAEKWVEKTLKKMTLEEKIGQMLMVFYFGGLLSTESEQYKELVRQVEQNHVGGLVASTRGSALGVERGTAYPTAVLANQLQRRAKVPLLVAADFERGTPMRVREGTSFPDAMAVAATGNPQDAYTMGRITALEARAAGVHWIFAPVADVNINPENPIINTRSFGEDPQKVAALVEAFVRGVEENGALACAKHFPGHGDTAVDSHVDLSVVGGDRARLESVELPPFRAAIAAGTSTIMTGHLAVPAIEPNAELPATMSSNILTGLLRRELGYQGIIVTDALDMGGVTVRYPPGEVAVRSVEAGADVLLVPPMPEAAIAALKEAVATGRIPVARIDESVRRILRAKARLGLHEKRLVDVDALNTVYRRPEFLAAAQEIADRGITLLRNQENLVPLHGTQPRRVLLVTVAGDRDPYPGEDIERELRGRVDSLTAIRTDTGFAPVETIKLPPLENYDLVLLALLVRVADRKNTVGLPANQAALVNDLLNSGKPVIVMSFGSPYLIAHFPQAKTWIAAFTTQDVAQRAAVRALFGQIGITGKLPVTVPGVAKLGDGLTTTPRPMTLQPAPAEMDGRLAPAYAVVERGVTEKAFPGGVLAVGYRGELAVRAFGRQSHDAKAPTVTPETIYDAASVTKPVVTATLIAMLMTAGRVQVDAPLVKYIPEFAQGPQPEWRTRVTLRHLLTHTSGLPTHRRYFLEARSKAEILRRAHEEALEFEPGTRAQYSDVGFILLGEVIERLTGKDLATLARERIFEPLGMKNSLFNPPANLRSRIAPTENDTAWRKRVVHGEVHDENAAAMGGIAGHAGLFTTAGDLAIFCQSLLNGGVYAHQRILSRRTIELFTTPHEVAGRPRALGWAAFVPGGSGGNLLSERSFGHTGFTGTSVWVDPERGLFVVLLTNRVHPSRENNQIEAVRTAVHDAVVESLGLKK